MIVFGSLTEMWQSVLKPGIVLYGTTVKQHSSTGRLGGQAEAIVNDTRVADMRRIWVSITIGVAGMGGEEDGLKCEAFIQSCASSQSPATRHTKFAIFHLDAYARQKLVRAEMESHRVPIICREL